MRFYILAVAQSNPNGRLRCVELEDIDQEGRFVQMAMDELAIKIGAPSYEAVYPIDSYFTYHKAKSSFRRQCFNQKSEYEYHLFGCAKSTRDGVCC